MRRVTHGALCLLALGLGSGCQAVGERIGEELLEWLEIAELEDGAQPGSWPSDGAMALRGPFELYVGLTESQRGVLPTVEVLGEESTFSPDCALDEGGLSFRCAVAEAVPVDEDFQVILGEGEGARTLSMSSRLPGSGRAWLLDGELTLERFGGDPGSAELLETPLAETQLLVVLPDGGPGELLLGEGRFSDEPGFARVYQPGLPSLIPVEVTEDQRLIGGPETLYLPIGIDGVSVPLRVDEARVEGSLDEDGLTLRAEGLISGAALIDIAEVLGLSEEVMASLVLLDEDRDGDGDPDAARLVASLYAPEVTLRGWVEED